MHSPIEEFNVCDDLLRNPMILRENMYFSVKPEVIFTELIVLLITDW